MPDWLCTLSQARSEIKVQTGKTTDDNWLIANIPLVSTRINVMTRMRFIPYYQQHFYDAFGTHIDDVQRKLDLGRPILLPTAVHDAFGNNLVYNTDYVTTPQDSPFYQLQLISTAVYGWSYGFGFGTYFWIAPGQFLRAIQVTGIWGYRFNYPQEGWVNSLSALANNGGSINATQTSFKVSSVTGFDSNAQSPQLDVGNVIQLSTNATPPVYEWMQIIAVQDNTITVNRAWNGSTAPVAGWPDGTQIFTWNVQPEINRAAIRWLGFWYSRRANYEAVKSDLSAAAANTYIYPADAPAEIIAIIEQTRDWRWSSV